MSNAHIKMPYTLAEIRQQIDSHEYSAELLLQHAMLLLEGRQPLTDRQIDDIERVVVDDYFTNRKFARAIEKAHGIEGDK